MKSLLELLAFLVIGALAIAAGISYSSRARKSEIPDAHEDAVRASTPAPSPVGSVDVTDSTPTAEAPVTNEEAAPATPAEPAQATYTVHCFAGNSEVYGLQKVTDDTMERDGDRWKFTNVDGHKTVFFTGTCLIEQD